MEFLLFLVIVIMSITLFLTIYALNDLSSKFNRVSKRYNLLLRGRGELNMEELLSSLSEEVDIVIDRVEYLELKSESLQKDFDKNTNVYVNELSSKLGSVNSKLEGKLDNINSSLEVKMEDINDILNRKIEENKEAFDKNLRDLSIKQKRDIERLNQESEDFSASLTDLTDKRINTISDQLAFAVQKVSLHRYNAFENQTGELSFTMVMLDRFNNGAMLTSINGRDSSYTYSKEIKNAKCEYEMSDDEKHALEKITKKK